MKIPRIYNWGIHFCNVLSKNYSSTPNRVIPVNNSSNGIKSFISRNFSVEKPPIKVPDSLDFKARSTRNYVVALGVLTLGAAYAAVPLYRIFCQASGYGGTVQHDFGGDKIENMVKKPYRKIRIRFMSDVSTKLQWKFQPQQKEIVVVPGETALAFYTATNPLDEPIIGISTYNVLPFEAGQYFNKIQCFCFEEQQLNPKETVSIPLTLCEASDEINFYKASPNTSSDSLVTHSWLQDIKDFQVDMPVFFYIDPEFCEDPMMERVDEIVLSYTFFQAKEGMSLSLGNPVPNKI